MARPRPREPQVMSATRPSRENNVLLAVKIWVPPDKLIYAVLLAFLFHARSVPGQNRKSSMRAFVFRCSPNNGHRQDTRHVRFVPCVDGSDLARAFFTFCSIGRCSHVFGL